MILSQFKEVNNTSNLSIYEIIQLQESNFGYIKQVLDRVNTNSGITSLIFFERENTDLPYCYLGDIVSESIIINEKINEELDTGSITLVHKGDVGFNDLIPNNTKVLLCENVNVSEVVVDGQVDLSKLFEFDSMGKPTNHSQFIVSGGALTQDRNELIVSQYGLVEPTAILRNAYTGTNSHTNMTETTIYLGDDTTGTTFTKDPTNLYSMIERQLRITGWKTSVEDRTWWKKCYIPQKTINFLKKVGVGASESFNSATLYDTFFKLGKYCKRYPVLYFNQYYRANANTDMFPQSKEFILDFEKYDGSDKPLYSYNDIVSNISGNLSVTNNTNRMSSRIVCEAQNLECNNVIAYPSENGFIGLTGKTTDIILEQTEKAKDYTIKVPFPIKEVQKITYIGSFAYVDFGLEPRPKTPIFKDVKCIKYEDWLLLNVDAQKNVAYYMAKGDKEIYVTHLEGVNLYVNTNDYVSFAFRVYYIPQMNSRIEKGDNSDYVDIINQTDSTIDSNLWGEFMTNYSLQQKNFNVFFEMPHDKLSDSLEIGGNIIKDNQKLIIVDKKIKINKSNVFVSYGCNYNIPKRSELVNASNFAQKNFIDSTKAFERLTNIKQSKKVSILNQLKKINTFYYLDNVSLYPIYEGYSSIPKINSCLIKFKYDSQIYDDSGTLINEKYIKTGINYYSSSNSIYINFVAMNSYIYNITGGLIKNPIVQATNPKFQNQSINRYADYFGNINNLDIYFSNYEDKVYDLYDNYNWGVEDPSNFFVNGMADAISYIINNVFTEEEKNNFINKSVIAIKNFEYLKDTNEILNFTFQLDFNGNDNIIVCNNFVDYVLLNMNDEKLNSLVSKALYIVDLNDGTEVNEFTKEVLFTNLNKATKTNNLYDYMYNNLILKWNKTFDFVPNKKYCLGYSNTSANIVPILIFSFNQEFINNIEIDSNNNYTLYLSIEDDN